jgi:hypothetical protein
MIVVSRSKGGSYQIAEVDRSLSHLKFAAFQLIPYYPHSLTSLEVTQYIDPPKLMDAELE